MMMIDLRAEVTLAIKRREEVQKWIKQIRDAVVNAILDDQSTACIDDCPDEDFWPTVCRRVKEAGLSIEKNNLGDKVRIWGWK